MNIMSKPQVCQGAHKVPWRPSLMDLPNELLERILEFCGVAALKILRLLHSRLLAASRSCRTSLFKHWRIDTISVLRFNLFMEQAQTIKGITVRVILGDSCEADKSMKVFASKRTELESVEIQNSECTDNTLRQLVHHPKIKIVRLSRSCISGENILVPLPSDTSISAVEDLNLSQCDKLTDNGILLLLNKTGGTLRFLNINNTNVSLADIGSLTSRLSRLEELSMKKCFNLVESSVISLFNLTGGTLKALNLSNTRLTFTDLENSATNFPVMENLNLSCCHNLTDDATFAFLNKIRGTLKILNLSHTSISFFHIGTFPLPLLEKLYLTDCQNMIDSRLVTFLNKTGETLKILNLSRTRVTLDNIGYLTISLPLLEELYLTGGQNMTDSGISSFLDKAGVNLKILDLSRTRVSFADTRYRTCLFPVLKELNLSGCYDMTESGISAFLNETAETIKILNLSDTKVSIAHMVESLTASFLVLEKLYLLDCVCTEAGLIALLEKTSGHLEVYLKTNSIRDRGHIKAVFPHLKIINF